MLEGLAILRAWRRSVRSEWTARLQARPISADHRQTR